MYEDEALSSRPRVLVMERGATVGLAIAAWLRGWGMEVELANTVAAAQARLAEAAFGLVIADAKLTGLDTGGLPVVSVLSPDSPPPSGRFVARPVQPEALRAAIAAVLAPASGIDLAAIDALWGGIDGPGFRRVAEAFIAEAGQRIAAIAAACAAGDRRLLEREAHSLAGAAVNVGAGAVATLARELELAAPAAAAPVLAERARALRATADRDLAELRLIVFGEG